MSPITKQETAAARVNEAGFPRRVTFEHTFDNANGGDGTRIPMIVASPLGDGRVHLTRSASPVSRSGLHDGTHEQAIARPSSQR
jgi:hypothetical protein